MKLARYYIFIWTAFKHTISTRNFYEVLHMNAMKWFFTFLKKYRLLMCV